MRLLTRSLSALVLVGVVTSGCGGKEDGSEVNGGSGNGDGTGTSGTGPILGGGDGTSGSLGSGSETIDPDMACAKGSASAALNGVNMFVMFDRSSSMNDRANQNGSRWDVTSAALKSFFASADAGGLKLALRFFPHDQPAEGCTQQGCDVAACSKPLVGLGTLSADAAPTDAQEKALLDATDASAPGMSGQGTPISAALGGALEWAKAQRKITTNENSVVVLVTDGEANGCDTDTGNIARLAANALASDGVRTYAIGLTGSQEGDINEIARAGGTDQGIFVSDGANTEQDLLDALGAIRGQVLDCDFAMPKPDAGVEVNVNAINVNYTSSSGTLSTLPPAGDAAGCAATAGWYYDDPANPSRIILCPAVCDTVTADAAAKLDVLLGCPTVVTVPK